MSTFDVRVTDDFMIDGLAVYITIRHSAVSRSIMRLHGDANAVSWDDVEPAAQTEPTFKLPGEAARALLDALLRHYEGASDMRTVRSDLLHERGRVDKLIGTISQIAASTHG